MRKGRARQASSRAHALSTGTAERTEGPSAIVEPYPQSYLGFSRAALRSFLIIGLDWVSTLSGSVIHTSGVNVNTV